jgi:hypothetical protein
VTSLSVFANIVLPLLVTAIAGIATMLHLRFNK